MQISTMITGAAGMVGSHLVDYYHDNNEKVLATYFKPTINMQGLHEKAIWIECDVRYILHLYSIIEKYKPGTIYHLAAQSYPTVSWQKPQETIDINVNGTTNLFEAIKLIRKNDAGYDPVVVVACSSAEYGLSLTPQNIPVKENTELLPVHPYGISKVGQDLLAMQYFLNDKIKTIRARIFNTTGPRKINDVMSDFTNRGVENEKGITNIFRVGNLTTERAITDVRDLVKALILLSKKGKYGEAYNICGQKKYLIKDLLQIIQQIISVQLSFTEDPALLRSIDEPIIFGDSTKLKNDTGWQQEITIEQTTKDMIDYWRKNL